MCSVKIRNLFIFMITSVWSLSALANLSGIGTKVTFFPGAHYQSLLFGHMLVTTETEGTINYTVTRSLIGTEDLWQKKFAVRLSQRDDGSYDIYRLFTPDGRKDGVTLLEGSFVRDDTNRTAVLEYNIEGNLWTRMEFSNTRTTFPDTYHDKITWRLGVKVTVTDGPLDRGRKIIKIEDELKWFDIVATP